VNCPRCDSPTKTLETRRVPDGGVRRRRECTSCGHRFTTYERAVPEAFEVIKRDGSRQPFDRQKMLRSLAGATHKRDVDPRRLSSIVDGVEQQLRSNGGELSATRITELCLEGLQKLDRGAYLQFAGTLPDTARSRSGKSPQTRKNRSPGSVRSAEDAALLTPKDEREEKVDG
jgi:transcriptional repressor NrdR